MLKAHQGKLSFMAKCLYMNLLVDFAQLLRIHGLYPKLTGASFDLCPYMTIVHSAIVSNTKMTSNQEKLLQQARGEKGPPFEKVRNAVEHANKGLLTKHLKVIVTKNTPRVRLTLVQRCCTGSTSFSWCGCKKGT